MCRPPSPRLHVLAAAVVAASVAPGAALAQSGQDTAPFDGLLAAWQAAPVGSEAETRASLAIQEFVAETLGAETLAAFRRYWRAPSGSGEEEAALAEARARVPEGIRWGRAREMMDRYFFLLDYERGAGGPDPVPAAPGDRAHALGPDTVLSELQVDLDLHVARERPVAGEIWNVYGEVHNRSGQQVWIVDTHTRLTVPQEIWGLTTWASALTAFFPTTPIRRSEVVRVDPGRRYAFYWQIDNWQQHHHQREATERERRRLVEDTTTYVPTRPAGFLQVGQRVFFSLRDFLFFHPGNYRLAANVHVWPTRPVFDPDGYVTNLGDSFTLSTIRDVEVASSTWVFMVGAIVGGLAAFFFLFLLHVRENRVEQVGGFRYFTSGLGITFIVSVIGTVLISRLGDTDFLLSITVDDFWGAIATGFLLQWIGLSYFIRRFEGSLGEGMVLPASGDGAGGGDGEEKVPVPTAPGRSGMPPSPSVPPTGEREAPAGPGVALPGVGVDPGAEPAGAGRDGEALRTDAPGGPRGPFGGS